MTTDDIRAALDLADDLDLRGCGRRASLVRRLVAERAALLAAAELAWPSVESDAFTLDQTRQLVRSAIIESGGQLLGAPEWASEPIPYTLAEVPADEPIGVEVLAVESDLEAARRWCGES